jgi:hypothetical protein
MNRAADSISAVFFMLLPLSVQGNLHIHPPIEKKVLYQCSYGIGKHRVYPCMARNILFAL